MPALHIGATSLCRNHHVTAGDLNRYGLMHGGRLLTLADETGFLAARAFCRRDCLTVAVHQARFLRPVYAGRSITATACVALTGRTSMWTPVRVFTTDDHQPVMDAVITYVAVDSAGKPAPVPSVAAATPAERALQRRLRRLRAQSPGETTP